MEQKKYQGVQPEVIMAPTDVIFPASGVNINSNEKFIKKFEQLIEKRGNIIPVTATRSENGAFSLASGYDALSAYKNSGAGKIPVVVAETIGDVDSLLLMVDLLVTHPTDHLAVCYNLCKLIDEHSIPRQYIAETLGKSQAWLSRMERISRYLTLDVKEMLSRGDICMRSAEEIALLPAEVQKNFADQVLKQELNKNQVSKWVSVYMAPNCSKRAKDIMIADPITYLKSSQKKSAPKTEYALFCRTLQRCKILLHQLEKIIGALPDSVMDDVHNQLWELFNVIEELNLLHSIVLPRDKFEEEAEENDQFQQYSENSQPV